MDTEPYEDPKMQPDFVRSTKNYLKEANLINVKKEIKREQEEAIRNPDK